MSDEALFVPVDATFSESLRTFTQASAVDIGTSIATRTASAYAVTAFPSAGAVRFDQALTLGSELEGTAWGRSADSIGLAFGSLRTSSDFRNDSLTVDADGDATPDFGYQAGGSEKQTELYYRFKLNSHVELSPNFQWIRNPGGNAAAPTVKVFGLRAKLGF